MVREDFLGGSLLSTELKKVREGTLAGIGGGVPGMENKYKSPGILGE